MFVLRPKHNKKYKRYIYLRNGDQQDAEEENVNQVFFYSEDLHRKLDILTNFLKRQKSSIFLGKRWR
jgi:hypothetical protein